MTPTLEEAKATIEHLPEHMQMPALLQLRAMLKIEIKTGMIHSKGSILKRCQQHGITKKRTKRGALADLNEVIKVLDGPEDCNPIE